MAKHIDYIDVAKGIATLLVIVGHLSITPEYLVNEIYTFHIPLFFFLSGFVLNVNKFPRFFDFLKDKFKKIIIPYFWLSILTWLWIYCTQYLMTHKEWQPLNKFIGIFLCCRDTPYYLSLWFLMSLFFAQLLFYIVYKMCTSQMNLFLFLCISFIVGYCISLNYQPGYFWALDTVPIATFFLGIGYLVKTNYSILTKFLKRVYLFVIVPLNIWLGYLNYTQFNRSDLFYQNLGQPHYYLLSAIFGIWATLIISQSIHSHSIFKYIGNNSLIFYAFHRPIFIPIAYNILAFLSNMCYFFMFPYVQLAVCLIIICLGLMILSEGINRYIPFVVGKKKF